MLALLPVLLWLPAPGLAGEVTVAVAANFLEPLRAIGTEFEAATGDELVIVAGSTGQLYAQIVNGAPFDVLLAADSERPALLAEQARGDPATRFTYATGRLALWSRRPDLVDPATLTQLDTLDFRWLAIANPDLAPYGKAAEQTLEALGVWSALAPARIVRGQSVAQAFAMAQTGNADLGLVALSQAIAYEGEASYAIVPDTLHEPIRQDAILLRRAADNPTAHALVEFLRGAAAAAIMTRYGYSAGAAEQ
jgi:molybdate transport system substrate-binding protein